MTVKSFPHISNDHSRVLILGTMPGPTSLLSGEYYAHPDNLFWDIMFRVLDRGWNHEEVVNVIYKEKTNLLLTHGVALWDVLQYCNRKGSLDREIKNEIKNDFPGFFRQHSCIHTIFFNGLKAQKYFSEVNHEKYIDQMRQFVLPSTSPSNGINSFKVLKEWTVIRNFLAEK